jgi:hypothetical protein
MKAIRIFAALVILLAASFTVPSILSHEKTVTLANRTPVEKIAGRSGDKRIYEITLPAGASNLHFTTWRQGGAGTVDIYARHDGKPTRQLYDAKSIGAADDKLIVIPDPKPGKYYVMVDASRGSFSGRTLSASYSLAGETFKTGMHSHRLYNGGDWAGPQSPEPMFKYAVIRDLNISHIHDAEVWKQDDSINFALIEKIYAKHARNGAKVLKNFGTVPTWASTRPEEPNRHYPDWPGSLSGPRDLDRYEDYVYRFVSRLSNYLWAVEGWNEPYACPGDRTEFTTMTPTRLADVQKRLYRATKRVDPTIPVFSPPQAYVCGIPTLLSARTSDGEPMWKFFDVLSWHPYNRSARGNAGPSYAKELYEVRQHLVKAGLPDMPIADSEHGWLTAPKEGGKEFYAMNDLQKAHVLYETSRLAKSLGVIAVVWYSYDGDMIGRPMTSPIISAAFQRMYDDLNSAEYYLSVPPSDKHKGARPLAKEKARVKP